MTLVREIGTATGTLDLMNKFATWVATLATWEMTLNQAPGDMAGAPNDRQVSFRRDGADFYFHWQSVLALTARTWMTCSTGAPVSGDEYDEHSGVSTDTHVSARAGISLPKTSTDVGGAPAATLRYWFHADDDYIIVSVNMDGGWYQHFYAGLVRGFDSADDCYYLCGSSSANSSSNLLDFDQANNYFANPFGPFGGSGVGDPYGLVYHVANDDFFPAVIGGSAVHNFASHTWDRGAVYTPSGAAIGGPVITTFDPIAVVPRFPVTLFHPSPLSTSEAPRNYALGNLQGVWYSPVDVLAEEAAFLVGSDNLLLLPAGKSRRIATSYRYVGAAILTTAS